MGMADEGPNHHYLSRNIFSAELQHDPYVHYQRMRREAPVQYIEPLKLWFITSYAESIGGLKEPALSSDKVDAFFSHLTPEERGGLRHIIGQLSRWILLMDPPAHTRLRTLVVKGFAPRIVEAFRPRITELTNELLDRIQGTGTLELVRDFAVPLPSLAISEMLGVPAGDRDRFLHWAHEILDLLGGPGFTATQATKVQGSLVQMENYLRGLIDERRRTPKNDLLGALVAAEEQGARLTEEEILATCVLLLFAGQETTAHLLSSGTWLLLRHPDELRKLRDGSASWASVVEEILRYEAPVKGMLRLARSNLELGGQRIPAGQMLYFSIAAANRDPACFQEPERFDVGRQDNRNLAFAHGLHYCVGAFLARLEGTVALEALFRRLPGMKLKTKTVRWRENLYMRALESLHVTF